MYSIHVRFHELHVDELPPNQRGPCIQRQHEVIRVLHLIMDPQLLVLLHLGRRILQCEAIVRTILNIETI